MKKITQSLPNLLFLISFFGLLFIAANALAVDGVIEISQAGAEAGGITPDDDPGFPVTVSEEGSYVLTSNLEVPADSDGIHITSPQVTLDLNGFTISGQGGERGTGVYAFTPSLMAVNQITVRNGEVCGMGEEGIEVGSNSCIEGIRAIRNDGNGIKADSSCRITGNIANYNGITGITVDEQCTIDENIAEANGSHGIAFSNSTVTCNNAIRNEENGINGGGVIQGNVARRNGGRGIRGLVSSIITENKVAKNQGGGISAGDGSTVTNNTAWDNAKIRTGGIYFVAALGTGDGCKIIGNAVFDNGWKGIETGTACTVSDNTAKNNANHGIGAGPGSAVIDNTVNGNGGYGLALTGNVGYKGNVITGNAHTVSGTGISMGDNVCGSDCTCP